MEIKLKKVLRKDWDYILKLRNESYENFYVQDKPLTKIEHYSYLKKQKMNKNFFQWIILKNNIYVGYVRILNSDVSIMIDKRFQNKKIGTVVLKFIEIEAKKNNISKLTAMILIKNKSSQKIFLKNDFKLKQWFLEKEIN